MTAKVRNITNRKGGKKLVMVTCYDYTFARLLDNTGIDLVLVGDSLGSVVLGHQNPPQVQLRDMVHHVRAVARGLATPLLCADMPFLSYHGSVDRTLANARRLVQAGAQCVKLEGGEEICRQIETLTQAGLPVIGHLGFTPQSIHSIGGAYIQGRNEQQSQRLIADARRLQDVGVMAVVLELIPAKLAQRITSELAVPTIGIGAGRGCDGQVLVLYDLLGCDSGFAPKFLRKYDDFSKRVNDAVQSFADEVRCGQFPTVDHEYH